MTVFILIMKLKFQSLIVKQLVILTHNYLSLLKANEELTILKVYIVGVICFKIKNVMDYILYFPQYIFYSNYCQYWAA